MKIRIFSLSVGTVLLSSISCISQVQTVEISQASTSNSLTYQIPAKVGQKTIMLKEVTSDSRCPEGDQCIWSGEVTVEVQIKSSEKPETKVLTFGTEAINPNQPEVLLTTSDSIYEAIDIYPYPKSGETLKPSVYKIILNAKKRL